MPGLYNSSPKVVYSGIASVPKDKLFIYKHTSMISEISMTKLKTVQMNERGILVIPEEIREDLGLKGRTNLVLIESGNEIILKKEEDVVGLVSQREDEVWKRLSEESLRRAWEKEDNVWDTIEKKKG